MNPVIPDQMLTTIHTKHPPEKSGRGACERPFEMRASDCPPEVGLPTRPLAPGMDRVVHMMVIM
jgi:hypothetical protein